MSKRIIVNDCVDVATRQYISSNKGGFSPGELRRGNTVRLGSSNTPMWEITFIDFQKKAQYKYRFADYMLIGRTPPKSAQEVKMVLSSDMMVSGTHAIIYIRDGKFIIEDKGSRNRTYLNGKAVTAPCVLEQGSVLKIGASKYQITLGRS